MYVCVYVCVSLTAISTVEEFLTSVGGYQVDVALIVLSQCTHADLVTSRCLPVCLSVLTYVRMVCCAVVWYGMVWYGWYYGMSGMVWVAWYGVVWCGMAWCGVVWRGVLCCAVCCAVLCCVCDSPNMSACGLSGQLLLHVSDAGGFPPDVRPPPVRLRARAVRQRFGVSRKLLQSGAKEPVGEEGPVTMIQAVSCYVITPSMTFITPYLG